MQVDRIGARRIRRQHLAQAFDRLGREARPRCRPPQTSASKASTPGPAPLATIASRSPCSGLAWARVSTAANSCSVVNTRSMPARRMAASNTSSMPASAPLSLAAARTPAGTAPGFQHQRRFAARRGARGRHELARIAQVLDVEQDRAGGAIAGEVVEHVAEVDVGRIAERDEMREADAARVRPVQHPGHQRARLRDEGDPARQRAAVGDAGVQAQAGRQQARRCSGRGCAAGRDWPRRAWPA